eukprot:461551-Rhodomonas_salina.1
MSCDLVDVVGDLVDVVGMKRCDRLPVLVPGSGRKIRGDACVSCVNTPHISEKTSPRRSQQVYVDRTLRLHAWLLCRSSTLLSLARTLALCWRRRRRSSCASALVASSCLGAPRARRPRTRAPAPPALPPRQQRQPHRSSRSRARHMDPETQDREGSVANVLDPIPTSRAMSGLSSLGGMYLAVLYCA